MIAGLLGYFFAFFEAGTLNPKLESGAARVIPDERLARGELLLLLLLQEVVREAQLPML